MWTNTYEIVDTVDGRFMVLVNGFQWGPPGSKPDASGAYPDTWATEGEARTAYQVSVGRAVQWHGAECAGCDHQCPRKGRVIGNVFCRICDDHYEAQLG